MKRIIILCAMLTLLSMALPLSAFAADTSEVCYPTSITRNEDGTEIRKVYDLAPEQDPAGIARSDFDQEGFHYTLIDLLKQELPEVERREHTETVTLPSKDKDMASVLALLPQEREFVTEDGLEGTLMLRLDTVKVEVSGYGSSIKQISATRTYPNLNGQDTQYIPKTIEENGKTLTLQNVSWQNDGAGGTGDRFTAFATYAGTATSSYVKGYTVTADYVGTVSRIALNRVRYVAIFEGTPIAPVEPVVAEVEQTVEKAAVAGFPWRYLIVPLGIVSFVGVGVGAALTIKRHGEAVETEESQ